MTKKELKRYTVIMKHMNGLITVSEAANELKLSIRQVFRLKKKILEKGVTGLIHKNRGRKPAHALSKDTLQSIQQLMTSEPYRHCNDHHLAELLAEHEGIFLSPSQNPPQKEKASHARSPHKPAANHPWREYNKPSKRVPQRA